MPCATRFKRVASCAAVCVRSIFAISAGGNVALLAGMNDERVKTIVTWSGPTDLTYMLAHGAAVNPINKYLGGADPAAASPINMVQPLSRSCQLHGSLTDFVPYVTQNSLRDILLMAGVEAETHIWAKGHSQAYGRFAWPPTLAWLQAHLP